MDLFLFFSKLAPALRYIFQLSYIPQENDFKELTPEQHDALLKHADDAELKNISEERILTLSPDDVEVKNKLISLFGNQLPIITEDDYIAFTKASEYIDICCNESGLTFNNLNDKLTYLARILPGVFTKGTPYYVYNKSDSK